jgi:hypothetical protein
MTLRKRVQRLEEASKLRVPRVVFKLPQETVEEAVRRCLGGAADEPRRTGDVIVFKWSD